MMQPQPQIIAIIGPESTGKTTLSRELSLHFNGSLVPEFAREFLEARNGIYSQADLPIIANGQIELEKSILEKGVTPIFCDTDAVVVMVWHEFKYGEISKALEAIYRKQVPRKYLLTFPDLPWQDDPLRENPKDLNAIFELYVKTLQRLGADYSIVKGVDSSRLKNAIRALS
ncbi:MAG: AAA family ATPase [Flavobacteriales bacterium]